MVKENRFSNYLLYAAGEIILVVIGILIALQINTWSKEAHTKALERTSLENLRDDLIIQNEIIQTQIDYEVSAIVKADSCNLFFDNIITASELYALLEGLASRHTFVANKATFNNLGAAGNVVLIHDATLQNAIVRFYQELDYTTAVVNNNNLFLVDNQFGNFLRNNVLGFRRDEKGSVEANFLLNPELQFTLQCELTGRKAAAASNQRLCKLQFDATEKLIQQISGFLEKK